MRDFIGVVRLETAIPCLKEVSGKIFKSKIAGHDISIVFPSIPENYDTRKVDIKKGDLVVPKNVFGEKVKWGMVNAWPKGLFTVQAFLCYASCEVSGIKEIYEDFPRWKEKLYNLFLIDTGNYLEPEQKFPNLIQGGGFDDGLQFFEVENGQPSQYIKNSRKTEAIKIRLPESKEAYSNEQLSELFSNAGSDKEIALSYELLITAYRAMERHDFRSAVVLGGTAVEQATLKRLRQEYSSNKQFRKDKSKPKYSTLGGRFRWLIEKSIFIPVADYKVTIVDIRNHATHDGIRPSYNETKNCLENCKVLIETYHPNKLEI